VIEQSPDPPDPAGNRWIELVNQGMILVILKKSIDLVLSIIFLGLNTSPHKSLSHSVLLGCKSWACHRISSSISHESRHASRCAWISSTFQRRTQQILQLQSQS
jgi:hypothetical protein